MFSILFKIYCLIIETVTLPFRILMYFLGFIYKIIFCVQIYMASVCRGAFGDGYGCDILDPSYVFTTILFSTIKLIIIGLIIYALYKYMYVCEEDEDINEN